MNIRDALCKAGVGGKIRLGEHTFNVGEKTLHREGIVLPAMLTVDDMKSLDWEALAMEWKQHADE